KHLFNSVRNVYICFFRNFANRKNFSIMMLDRLQYVKQCFDEVSDLIIQPDVIADQKRYVQLNKEYKDLKALVEKREEYINIVGNIDEAKEIIADGSDAEMVEMAKMQLVEAQERLPQLEEEIK